MQGKKGCYWGFDTVHNKVAWVATLGFVVSGAALLATGIKTVNGCHEQYQTCRAANGPLSDVDSDKCVPILSACAKPAIAQYTIGAILLAGVVLPAFYFCCCAIKPDKDARPGPAAVVPEMDGVGKKTQSVDCEKQTSQQVRQRVRSSHDLSKGIRHLDVSCPLTKRHDHSVTRFCCREHAWCATCARRWTLQLSALYRLPCKLHRCNCIYLTSLSLIHDRFVTLLFTASRACLSLPVMLKRY